jgi:hypothetical protein
MTDAGSLSARTRRLQVPGSESESGNFDANAYTLQPEAVTATITNPLTATAIRKCGFIRFRRHCRRFVGGRRIAADEFEAAARLYRVTNTPASRLAGCRDDDDRRVYCRRQPRREHQRQRRVVAFVSTRDLVAGRQCCAAEQRRNFHICSFDRHDFAG